MRQEARFPPPQAPLDRRHAETGGYTRWFPTLPLMLSRP